MEARGKHTPFRYLYAWLLTGATAVALVIGLWIAISSRPLAAPQKVARQTAGSVTTQPGGKIIPAARRRHRATKLRRRRKVNGAGTVQLAAAPRLEQFPSPRPLSQQEVLLAKYAQHFPAEAAVIAQQQDKFQQEIEQAEQEINASRSSERQER